MRTQHQFCDIPAKDVQPESNLEEKITQKDILKNNQNLKLLQHNEQPQKAKNSSKLRESEKKKNDK